MSNEKKTNYTGLGTTIGLCIGTALGMIFGLVFDNLPVIMSVGMIFGLGAGSVVGSYKDNKILKENRKNEQKEQIKSDNKND